jgi:hypothetical protein
MHAKAARALFETEVKRLEPAAKLRGWHFYQKVFPILDVGFRNEGRPELRVRLSAPNWNDDPPSVELLDAAGNALEPGNTPAHGFFNRSAHPATGHPFICSPGALEYHTHPSHTGDRWENYKSAFTIGDILTRTYNAWLDATR